jgi:hypothetical protein
MIATPTDKDCICDYFGQGLDECPCECDECSGKIDPFHEHWYDEYDN